MHQGRATFTIGAKAIEVATGQVVLIPPGVPHRFVNSGDDLLRMTAFFPSARIIIQAGDRTYTFPQRRPGERSPHERPG